MIISRIQLLPFLMLLFLFASGCSMAVKSEQIPSNIQAPQWGQLQPGEYAVGYRDTVLFKSDENFSYFTFNGPKPFYVSIWYPAEEKQNKPFMKMEDYLNYPKNERYTQLYDSLTAAFHSVNLQYGVRINLANGDDRFAEDSVQLLYRDILQTQTAAQRNITPLNKSFPCILYHHGAQSIPFDNNVFCEYMASRGFIVVSSSYNLPSQWTGGLTVSTDEQFNDVTDIDFILAFAGNMSGVDKSRIVATGHSWGAQALLRHDNERSGKLLKCIVSLHTTLEDVPIEYAREGWPEFSYLFDNQCTQSTTPSFLLAPYTKFTVEEQDTLPGGETRTGKKTVSRKPGFIPFRNNMTTPYRFVTVNYPVKHDGFITCGNLRFPFCEKYNLKDKEEIKLQQKWYEYIVELTYKVLSSSTSNKEIPSSAMDDDRFSWELFNVADSK